MSTGTTRNVRFSLLDLTEIEFALCERIARHEVLAVGAEADHAVFVLLERDRAALAKVRAAL